MLPDAWRDVPRHLPRKCAVTNHSTADNGPYWETSFVYFDAMGDTPHTLYLSQRALMRPFLVDGAPDILEHEYFAPRVQERVEALVAERLASKDAELEEMRERLETLRRAVEPMRTHFGVMPPPEKKMGRPRKHEPVVEAAGLDEGDAE